MSTEQIANDEKKTGIQESLNELRNLAMKAMAMTREHIQKFKENQIEVYSYINFS